VVAYAALERLGLAAEATDVLEPEVLLPQVGQGALAVECRADDERTVARLRAIDDPAARRTVHAERAFLAELGGGCNLPCGALAKLAADGKVVLDALLASLDGHVLVRTRVEGDEPGAIGRRASDELRRAFPEDLAS